MKLGVKIKKFKIDKCVKRISNFKIKSESTYNAHECTRIICCWSESHKSPAEGDEQGFEVGS